MKKRARDREKTRQRIVEAAVRLHGTVGPRNTSISAVAEEAGVQRLTVYRHFPGDAELFQACSAHWLSLNPPPDASTWSSVEGAVDKTRIALEALYDYYGQTGSMWQLVYRDVDEVDALQEPMAGFQEWLDSVRNALLKAWQPRGRRPAALRASLAHALEFATWKSLREQGLSNRRAAALVLVWLEAVAGEGDRSQAATRPRTSGGT